MILHLSDDNIFLDCTIDQFETVAPGLSVYLVSTSTPKRIRNIDKILTIDSNTEQYKQFIDRLQDFDAVILHALTEEKVEIVNKASKNVNFVWMMWGADGFYLKEFNGIWYSAKTKNLLNNPKEQSSKSKIYKALKYTQLYNLYFFLRKGQFPSNIEKLKAIKRIKYIAPVIEEDYTIIKEKFHLKEVKYLPYSHGSIETLITDNERQNTFYTPKENRILLGNSADPSNNHIDIIYLLKELNFKGEVICPLSYGNEKYKNIIILEGKRILGSSFNPLIEFLPLEKYQKIISSCNIVIMNHYRQQAMGNIISSIWHGAKVFLNQKNPAYHFFNRIGVKILTIQEDISVISNSVVLMNTIEHTKENREALNKYYSQDVVLAKTKELIKKIC